MHHCQTNLSGVKLHQLRIGLVCAGTSLSLGSRFSLREQKDLILIVGKSRTVGLKFNKIFCPPPRPVELRPGRPSIRRYSSFYSSNESAGVLPILSIIYSWNTYIGHLVFWFGGKVAKPGAQHVRVLIRTKVFGLGLTHLNIARRD
jgi:hypothetical protein